MLTYASGKQMIMNNGNRNLDATRARADLSNQSSDDFGPAYGFGVNARGRYPGRDFDDVESEMSSDWAAGRGASILSWDWARHAA